jgi:hypothetical protein
MCQCAADGSLIVRGIGLSGDVIFQFELGKNTEDMLMQSGSNPNEMSMDQEEMEWTKLDGS